MITLALTLLLAIDGGSDAPVVSGFIGVHSGVFLLDNGSLMTVDGGVWANDETLIQTAFRQRVVREQLKLAQDEQQREIGKWIGIGAVGGAAVTAIVVLVLYFLGSLGK